MTIQEINGQLDNGLAVFIHYLGSHVKVGRHYKSPFGHEGRESFNLFIRGDGQTCFCDHAFVGDGKSGEFQGSCYDFVMRLFNVDFKESTRIIKREVLGLSARETESGLSVKPMQQFKPLIPQAGIHGLETVGITGYGRPWEEFDLAFFAGTGITRDTLNLYHCQPLDGYQYRKGSKQFAIHSKPGDPIYGYHFPATDHWKIYRPFAADKRFKWISNVDARADLFGWDTLPGRARKVYLCAGQRDCMALHSLTGLPCIALNSETAKMTPELYQLLTCVADEVHCCLDNDKTGLAAQDKLRFEWGIIDAGNDLLESANVNDLSELLQGCDEQQRHELAHHFSSFSVRKCIA